jgi:membrane protease YdiL (CAAX protease family)
LHDLNHPPRSPARRPSRSISWLLILAASAGIVGSHLLDRRDDDEQEDRTALVVLTVQAKILVGADRLQPGAMAGELRNLDSLASSPAVARALAALNAALGDGSADGVHRAMELLDLHRFSIEDPEEIELHEAVRSAVENPGALTSDQRTRIEEGMDWFGRLLLTRDSPAGDPAREELLQEAVTAVVAALVLVAAAAVCLLAGIVLLIAGILMVSSSRIRFRLSPSTVASGIPLRAFAVYLVLAFLLAGLPSMLGLRSMLTSIGGIAAASLAGLAWPFLQGGPAPEMRRDLGLHRGNGLLVEAGCGAVGYLAILPVLAVGFLMTIGLISATEVFFPPPPGSPPRIEGHPVSVWMAHGGTWVRLLILGLACAFSPFFEEVMFRGALQGSLRERFGSAVSALIAGTLFAAIHPQGLVAVPAILALAVGFSFLREWRGSLVAPMVAHAIHNGILISFLWILL